MNCMLQIDSVISKFQTRESEREREKERERTCTCILE